ncbi:uncharacterized protein [Clytia hemisphaerica]|uniref:Zinc finger PHD-type domain-containing protein n=2 Tax=Clytia hemisphaerica TaxID=252671 RepID=A0A7M5UYZ9_9CNID
MDESYQIYKRISAEIKKHGFDDNDLKIDYNENKVSITCVCMKESLIETNSSSLTKVKRHSNKDSHKIKCGWYIDTNLKVVPVHKGTKDIRLLFGAQKRPPNTTVEVPLKKRGKCNAESEIVEDVRELVSIEKAKVDATGSALAETIENFSKEKISKKSDSSQINVENLLKHTEALEEAENLKRQQRIRLLVEENVETNENEDFELVRRLSKMWHQIDKIPDEIIEDLSRLSFLRRKESETESDAMLYTVAHFKSKVTAEEKIKQIFQDETATACEHPEVSLLAARLREIKSKPNSDGFINFVTDVVKNYGRKHRNWSDDTKTLFAILYNYGGKKAAMSLSQFVDGPSIKTIWRTASSDHKILCTIEPEIFESAKEFYDIITYDGPFQISLDATSIIPTLRMRNNTVYGLATSEIPTVITAEEILQLLEKNHQKANLANLFLLVPLVEHVPPFVIAIKPAVKSETSVDIKNWFLTCRKLGIDNGLKIIGLGADGDAKVRKFYTSYFSSDRKLNKKTESMVIVEGLLFGCIVEKTSSIPAILFPDWKHLIKKWRNQLLNVKRLLFLGKNIVMLEHLLEVYTSFKMAHNLSKTDVYVRDKQNVDAALRILDPRVRACLRSLPKTSSTCAYLKVGEYIKDAFTSKTLSISERAKLAWFPVLFVRFWKSWIQIKGFELEQHFISNQTFQDLILAGHSIILSMLAYSKYFENHPFQPWTFGSDACEKFFAKLRGFVRGKPNLTFLDMLDFSKRLQRLAELERHTFAKEANMIFLNDPEKVESEVQKGMKIAEEQCITLLNELGMVEDLEKGNILLKGPNNEILIKNVDYHGWTENWNVGLESVNEDHVIDLQMMTGSDKEILDDAIDASQKDSSLNEIDRILPSILLTKNATIDLNQCGFRSLGKCKDDDDWICCEVCEQWFHLLCVGLKFKKKSQKQRYIFTCPKHKEAIKDVTFRSKIAKDTYERKSIIQEETLTIKDSQAQVSGKANFRNDGSKLYVKYEGNIYHIARFLSIAMGKVYSPAASRSERWKSSNTNDFFNRLPLPADPNGLQQFDRCLFKNKTSVVVGRIVRILRKVGKFSTFCELSTKNADPNVTYTFFIDTSKTILLLNDCFCKIGDEEFETEKEMLVHILKKKKTRFNKDAAKEKLFKLACKCK